MLTLGHQFPLLGLEIRYRRPLQLYSPLQRILLLFFWLRFYKEGIHSLTQCGIATHFQALIDLERTGKDIHRLTVFQDYMRIKGLIGEDLLQGLVHLLQFSLIQICRRFVLLHSRQQTYLLGIGPAHIQSPHQGSHQILAGSRKPVG